MHGVVATLVREGAPVPDEAHFGVERIGRYDGAGTGYASYPLPTHFRSDFDSAAYSSMAHCSNEDPIPRRLSLHLGHPLHHLVSLRSASQQNATGRRTAATAYLQRLQREIRFQGALYDRDRAVAQLSIAGGPSQGFSIAQIEALVTSLADNFTLSREGEHDYAIDVVPGTVDERDLSHLRELGFNRLNVSVPTFEPDGQRSACAGAAFAQTVALVSAARGVGFDAVGIDLARCLAHESAVGLAHTLDAIVEQIHPERLRVRDYATLPRVLAAALYVDVRPNHPAGERLTTLRAGLARLAQARYVHLGMDQFARADDALVRARDDRLLQLDWRGYATHADCDRVGMGPAAISRVADCYAQNERSLRHYCRRIDAGRLATSRGVALDGEDLLRRAVIEDLTCYGAVEVGRVNARFAIDFDDHFATERSALRTLHADGLLTMGPSGIRLTPAGRLIAHTVCEVFDSYRH